MLAAIAAIAVFVIQPARAQVTIPSYYGTYPPVPAAGQWSSSNVFYSGGYLTYVADTEGNRVPDYSYAGYHYGEKALPTVAVVNTLGPIGGDETARIQAALDAIGSLPLNASGHRGALLLLPGTYEIWGTLRIRQSGVVLRGSGDGTNPAVDTILFARGNNPNQRTVVIVGSNDSTPWDWGSEVQITNQFVQVGSMSVNVSSAAGFAAGQEIVVRHPSPQTWIDAVGGGGMVDDADWTAGSKDLRWIRRITRVDGTRLYLDAPIYNHLNRALCQPTVARITGRNHTTECGIENLRIDIETLGGEDEAHAWNALGFVGADNSWALKISARYFGYAAVRTSGAIRITVKDCRGTDPVAIRTGGRMYNFVTDSWSQLVLFTGCHAGQGRHAFISNGTMTVSGAVWHRCTVSGGDFEAHRHWSQGMLLDNARELGSGGNQAKLINRGDFGTSHGWGAAHSMIWQYNKEMTVQKPPTAQNYAVSTEGTKRNSVWFPGPFGSIEIKSGTLVPQSLYEAQLCNRLALRPAFLIARHSGKALRVNNADTADGATIVQSPTTGLSFDGEWFLVGIGAGYSRITARHSDKDMIVEGASAADGAAIVQNPYSAGAPAHDEWQIVPVTNEFYRVVNRFTGKVLGIAGASTADGAQLLQMTWSGDTHQQFRVQARPEIFAAPPPLQIGASPGSTPVEPGNAVNFNVTVDSTLPSGTVVALSVTGLPANTSAGFTPTSVTNSGSSTLNVSTALSTPIGNYNLTITGTATNATNSVIVVLSVSSNAPAAPGLLRWTASGGADTNWGNFVNWTNIDVGGIGTPVPGSHILFGSAGTTPGAGTINNVIETDYTVSSLIFTNTTGYHTTLITPGSTLTITGSAPNHQNAPAINVGMEGYGANTDTIRSAITGDQGSIVINNSGVNIQVRQGFGSGTVGTLAELDMSGLGSFNANINRIQIGAESGAPRRVAGTLRLARANVITLNQALTVGTNLTGGSPALYLGHNTQAGNVNGSTLYLGLNNDINVNYVVIGRGNQTGNLLAFNPVFIGEEPSAQFRASDGIGRVGLWVVGDNSPGSITAPSSGTNDFTGGIVDVLVDKMFIGRGRFGTTVNTGFGTLTFNGGTIDVNELRLGTMVDEVTSTNSSGVGVANVNGDAVLIVNTVLDLAHTNIYATATPAAIAATRGTLNVNGGTAILNSAIAGGGASTINVNGGIVELATFIGTPGSRISAVQLTNATLQLRVNGAAPITNINAASLVLSGANVVNIDSALNIGGTASFPLLSYGALSGAAADVVLGDLPAGFSGGLLHDAAAKTINLVVTPTDAIAPQFVNWNSSAGELVVSGANGAPLGKYFVLTSTNVVAPLVDWIPISTNNFDVSGNFNFTNTINADLPTQFYMIQVP